MEMCAFAEENARTNVILNVPYFGSVPHQQSGIAENVPNNERVIMIFNSIIHPVSVCFTSIVREEATSALTGFHPGLLSWSNYNLKMSVSAEGGKPEIPEKNLRSKARTINKTQPTEMAPGQNRTQATLVGGERSHHCANSAPQSGK